ncbi:hypothetical protein FRC11_011358, partial [Ceratobasidium sp. 423]
TVQVELAGNAAHVSTAISQDNAEHTTHQSWKAESFANRMNSITKLMGINNFSNWAFRVHQAALDAKITGHFTDLILQPDCTQESAWIAWTEDHSAISSSIYVGIAEAILPHLKHLGHNTSPKMIWDELHCLYAGNDSNCLSGILDKIVDANYSNSNDFDIWLATICE